MIVDYDDDRPQRAAASQVADQKAVHEAALSQEAVPSQQEIDNFINAPFAPTEREELKQLAREKFESLFFQDSFFSMEQIDATLQKAGTSLERFKEKFWSSTAQFDRPTLMEYRAFSTDEAKARIAKSPNDPLSHLPFIYNLVHEEVSLRDYLNLALENAGEWERGNSFFRWMPLYEPHLPSGQIESYMAKLLECERDLKHHPLSEYLVGSRAAHYASLYADNWFDLVSPEFAEDLVKAALELDREIGLFHSLPYETLSSIIGHERLQKYAGKDFDDIPETSLIEPAKSQNQSAGTCSHCQGLHWSTLMKPEDESYGEVAILRANGKAAFSLKLWREPSMVALDSFRTPDGKLAAVRGGIYVPPKEIREQFDDFKYGEEKFRIYDLKEPMKILPLGWADNVDAKWNSDKFQKYLSGLEKHSKEFSE